MSFNEKNRKPNAICVVCDTPFYRRPNKADTHLYCTYACYKNAHYEKRQCPGCNREFSAQKSDPKQYCTVQCANKTLKSKTSTTKKCPICGETFYRYGRSTVQYCSKQCAGKAKDRRNTRTCEYCKKDFYPPKGMYEKKYCSASCAHQSQNRKVTLVCPVCKKDFVVSPSFAERGQKYCSAECRNVEKPAYRIFRTKLETGTRTSIEATVEQALVDLNIPYIWEKRFGRYWVDFYIPHLNIAIECDEPHWHDKERDAKRDTYITNRYQVRAILRFTTEQIKGNIKELIKTSLQMH